MCEFEDFHKWDAQSDFFGEWHKLCYPGHFHTRCSLQEMFVVLTYFTWARSGNGENKSHEIEEQDKDRDDGKT